MCDYWKGTTTYIYIYIYIYIYAWWWLPIKRKVRRVTFVSVVISYILKHKSPYQWNSDTWHNFIKKKNQTNEIEKANRMKSKISPSLIFLQYQLPKFLNFLKIFIPRSFVKLFFFLYITCLLLYISIVSSFKYRGCETI